jgi:hypothetical protein
MILHVGLTQARTLKQGLLKKAVFCSFEPTAMRRRRLRHDADQGAEADGVPQVAGQFPSARPWSVQSGTRRWCAGWAGRAAGDVDDQ